MTNTISATVNHPIVLDSSEFGSYGSQLTITTSGDVAATFASGVFANESNDSIKNARTISRAPGGNPIGLRPRYGVDLGYGTLTNTGMIFGGSGGTKAQIYIYGSTGVLQRANATGLTNQGTIEGGAAASTLQAGNGGAGVVQSGTSLLNSGTIKGGGGGTYGGDGGAGAKPSGGSLTNDNTIYGGAGGSNTGFFMVPAVPAVMASLLMAERSSMPAPLLAAPVVMVPQIMAGPATPWNSERQPAR